MTYFKRSKKGSTWDSTILPLIIILVVISLLIPGIRNAVMDFFKGGEKLTECESGAFGGQVGRCVPASYYCEDKISGLGCEDKNQNKPICCFDQRAYTLDEAKALFTNTFQGYLNECKTDASKCDEASQAMIDLLMYTEGGSEGKVFMLVKRSTSSSTTFSLVKRETFWSLGAEEPPAHDSFVYQGDMCVIKTTSGDDIKTVVKDKNFIYCIGKEKEGMLVGDCEGKIKVKGDFISLRHLVENDPNTPVCILYAE